MFREYPQITTRCVELLRRALVEHLVAEIDHGSFTGNVDLMFTLVEVMNGCVLAEVTEPGNKGVSSLDTACETGKHHDYVVVHHLGEILDSPGKPCLVDLVYR